jgi:nitrous oxide reductase accessory protein NosL
MKRTSWIILSMLLLLIVGGCVKEEGKPTTQKFKLFQTVDRKDAIILQKGDKKESCVICGMKLPMFYKTNHVATHNGEVRQYCSIHCLAEDRSINKTELSDIKVVAVDTLKFIPIKDATYVVGSDVRGTMSGLSKYAFKGRMSARRFASKHQGKIMNFDEAYQYALKDFAK